MIKTLFNTLANMVADLISGKGIGYSISFDSVDFSDIFPTDIDDLLHPEYVFSAEFRVCPTIDDYHQDLLCILENNKGDFRMDYSHGDGHFRV